MSAARWLSASVMAHLDQNAALDPMRVFDFAPTRVTFPFALVEDPVLRALDGAGVSGRVGTIAIQFRDGGERQTRLRWLVGRLEDEMEMLPSDLGEGWWLAGLSLTQTRVVRAREEWAARSVWAVRVFRVN